MRLFASKKDQIMTIKGGLEPFYLPTEDTTDPEVLTYAELLFWSEGFKDHNQMAEILLPANLKELDRFRQSAIRHQEDFQELHERLVDSEISKEQNDAFLNELAKHAQMVNADLQEMEKQQFNGKIHTLIWPLMIDHLLREGEYFLARKEMLMADNPMLDTKTLVQFWSEIMGDHGLFVAKMLDADEIDLEDRAVDAADRFYTFSETPDVSKFEVMSAVTDLIDFKTTLLYGVQDGSIGSIIMPELANHLRNEALFFQNSLKRS